MATNDLYGVHSILDQMDAERTRAGQPALHPDVRAKVAADIGGTRDYLNQAKLDGRLAGAEKSHYMNMGFDKKREIVTRYASDMAEHHAANGNVSMPGDHSHLSDLFTGRKQLPVTPPPVPPTTTPSGHGPVIPGPKNPAGPVVPVAEPVQARLDWMHDELKGLPRTGSGVIAESAKQGQIRQLLEPHIADHINTHGEVLSEQKVRSAVRTLAGKTPAELNALSHDELRKILDPKAAKVKTPGPRVQTPLRAGGTAQMDGLIRASSEQIDHVKDAKIKAMLAQGPVPADRLAQVEEAAHTAKLHLRDSIEAHHAPGKFGTAEAPHISESSVRSAATSHFDAVHSGELGRSVPESRLWENIHSDPHAGVSSARKTVLRQLATDPKTRVVDPHKFDALLSREKTLASTLTEAGSLQQLQALEKKVMLTSHQHFSELNPLERQARLQLFDHAHAAPSMQQHLMTHHEVERPGFFRRQVQKFRGPKQLGDGMFHHYDGSVSRVVGDEVQMIQHGWDHAGAHSQARIMQTLERNKGIMYAAGGPMPTGGIPSATSIAASRQAVVEAEHVAATAVQAESTAMKLLKGSANLGKKSLSAGGQALSGTGKFLGKGLLVAGGAAAGFYVLNQLMKSPRPPRRLDMNDDLAANDPVVFTGNSNVSVGALSVPQVGQQQQAGSWMSRVQPLDPETGLPSMPQR